MIGNKGRQARATALLAGNGLILLKLFDTYWEIAVRPGPPPPLPEFLPVGIATLVGMAAAYSMFGIVKGRIALFAEALAAVTFISAMISWLSAAAGGG